MSKNPNPEEKLRRIKESLALNKESNQIDAQLIENIKKYNIVY